MRRPYPFDAYNRGYAYAYAQAHNHPYYHLYNEFIPPMPPMGSNNHNLYPQYNRKRQRRQAAALVVDSLWNNNSSNNSNNDNASRTNAANARKSTAQPRPVLNIPPKGIGPIAEPNENDVLCGRGGRINSHAGNVQFRDIIHAKKKEYLAPTTKKLEKAHIAAGIVNDIRTMNPPGRFLKEEKSDGMWYDIGDAKAIKKTGQALREDAPDIRTDIDDKKDAKTAADKTPTTKNRAQSPVRNVSPRSPHASVGNHFDSQYNTQQQIWPDQQVNNNLNPDYHGQMAMPPPFMQQQGNNNAFPSQQVSSQQPYMQQHQPMQNQQGFQTRNIPIQVPVQTKQPAFPNQIYSGVQSPMHKHSSTSRKAMEALNQAGPMGQQQQQQYAPYGGQPGGSELPFGMQFHDPNGAKMSSIGDDHTISTISGLSEPVSSLKSGMRNSDLMNMSLRSINEPAPSVRSGRGNSDLMNMSVSSNLSFATRLRRMSSNLRGSVNKQRVSDPLMQGPDVHRPSFDPMRDSILSGFGNGMRRSSSFGDIDTSDNWKFEGEPLDDSLERAMTRDSSLMLGGAHHRLSSNMSIGSIMDVQSNASSGQWFQAAMGNLPNPDDKSILSSGVMSADLDALDLASTF